MENIWNIYARHYDTLRLLPPYQVFQKDIVQNIILWLKKTQNHDQLNVLDIGCGTGNLIKMFLDNIDGHFSKAIKVVGVDNSIEMIKIARTKVGNDQRVDLREGNIDNIIKTLKPSSYQAVIMSNVLYNLKNPAEVISKIDELLCSGGVLIISDPKPDFRYSFILLHSLRSLSFLFLLPRIVNSLWWIYLYNRRAIDGEQSHFCTASEVKNFIDETKFKIVKIEETYAKQNFLITAVKQ